MERKACRKFHKELRESMTTVEASEKSIVICRRMLQEAWYVESSIIYGYYPLGNEVNILPFLAQAMMDGKRVALPRTGEDCQMEFYEITSFEDVKEGSFHVLEPKKVCPLVQEDAAVVLVPGVVFDKSGNRYGYGKGYYDRYFERFPRLKRFAAAYEHQMEDEIEVLQTDVKMHRVYTESGCYCCDADKKILLRV